MSFSIKILSFPERKKEISFKLPLNRTNIDTGYDQGYGSERSPEDELPPPLPMMLLQPAALALQPYEPPDVTVQQNYLDQYWSSEKQNFTEYDFITQGECHSWDIVISVGWRLDHHAHKHTMYTLATIPTTILCDLSIQLQFI
jgi:hypothetical protein